MVIRNTFKGTVDDYSTTETVAAYLVSDTVTTNISDVATNFSKQFINALYTTLVDAGYVPTLDEDNYTIDIWGFKFYCFILRNGYYYYPKIYCKGGSSISLGDGKASSSTGYHIAYNSSTYSYTLSIRGHDNMFYIQFGGTGYETYQYNLFWLAKATYTPTNNDGFVFGTYLYNSSSSSIYGCESSDLYNLKINGGNLLQYVNRVINSDFGIGIGYPKIPLCTTSYEFVIKGLIFTNFNYVVAGEYYQLGNEIYYANKSNSSGEPFLYKVDNVTTS